MSKKSYSSWLEEFTKGKREVPSSPTSDQFGIRSLRRYVDAQDHIWETAITYTGRLVLRHGRLDADGISIEWEPWVTEHDIEVPTHLNTLLN